MTGITPMRATPALVPVTTTTAIDPSRRRFVTMPHGLTIAEIIAANLPEIAREDWFRISATLLSDLGHAPIGRDLWHVVRPRAGVHVVLRIAPGKDALRSVLSIVVSVAAVAFAPVVAGWFGVTSTLGISLFATGLTVIGTLLINALIPPTKTPEQKNTYQISGWSNRLEQNGAVPSVMGQIRYAPPFAATSYTEIVGDWQYIRALFVFGYGELDLGSFWIGETAIEEYDEVEIDVRTGRADDAPLSLYNRQILEEAVSTELVRPLPRNDAGDVIDGQPAEDEPVTRTTGADALSASVIIGFPGGLVRYNDKGEALTHAVSIRIEQREITAENWIEVTTITFSAKKLESFYRQHSWELPTRGRYQVRLTMLTDETESSQVQQRCQWAALQTIRPEYPLAVSYPLALVAVRVKATHQLSGALDNFSAVAARVCPDWDAATQSWITRTTRNPASLYRYALQSRANQRRVEDSGIDLDQLADWHEFCDLHGLTFSKVYDEIGTTLRDVLTEIAAAGRATPRHDGTRWGVTIDRPSDIIVDHITPRTSWDLKITRAYIDPPHAMRVTFADEENDYKQAERWVRWPGYTGDIETTEVLELPGATNAAVVWRETRRRQLEVIYRPDTYQVTQAGAVRVATRGDTVLLQSDILDRVLRAGRVRSVNGAAIELDEAVEMEAGVAYAIRWRSYADENDAIGSSILRHIRTEPGASRVVYLTETDAMPGIGDLVMFGRATSQAARVIVRGVEAASDLSSIVHAIPAAEVIDEVLAATEIPAWSSRVGAAIADDAAAPGTPIWLELTSGIAGADQADHVVYRIGPGNGTEPVASYEIRHRIGGATAWTSTLIPAAAGGGILTYASGVVVEMQAVALSAYGQPSDATAIISLTVGGEDLPIPTTLDESTISITALLGGVLIQFATGDDPAVSEVQVYRSTSASLDRAFDAAGKPISVSELQSYSVALGDTTRATLVMDGSFNAGTAWEIGDGWTIASGLANHAPGTASVLSQNLPLAPGLACRLSYRVAGRTAGTITAEIEGSSIVVDATVASDGLHAARLIAPAEATALNLVASSDFDGSVDDVTLYLETGGCLAQGTHYLWIEPRNADGIAGPISGPYTVEII